MSYDPNQPRDDHGRWGEIGQWTGSPSGAKKMSLEGFESFTKQSLKVPLSQEEIAALENYRSGSFYVNDRLRGTPGHDPKYLIAADDDIAKLDNAFRKAALKEPIDVYRAIEKPFQQFMSGHDEFIDKGFLSTSIRPDVLRLFNSELSPEERKHYSVIKIAVPRGFPAIPLGPHALGYDINWAGDNDFIDRETVLKRSTRLKRVGELAWKAVE